MSQFVPFLTVFCAWIMMVGFMLLFCPLSVSKAVSTSVSLYSSWPSCTVWFADPTTFFFHNQSLIIANSLVYQTCTLFYEHHMSACIWILVSRYRDWRAGCDGVSLLLNETNGIRTADRSHRTRRAPETAKDKQAWCELYNCPGWFCVFGSYLYQARFKIYFKWHR